MIESDPDNQDRTEIVNPIAKAINQMIQRNTARPHDVYRLAIIVEGILDSMDDPEALQTVRGELRALLSDLSQTGTG